MNTSRRGFLLGVGAVLAAPAIVRIENIMPVRNRLVTTDWVYWGEGRWGEPPWQSNGFIGAAELCDEFRFEITTSLRPTAGGIDRVTRHYRQT